MKPSTRQMWPWPESLDALAAAPAFHGKLLENERVRVLHTLIPAGALVPLHTHQYPAVAYVTSASHSFAGTVRAMSRLAAVRLVCLR
jgi:hypothetical protein